MEGDEIAVEGVTVIEDLAATVRIPRGAVESASALVGDGVRLVTFGFDADQSLNEHSAGVPILIQVVCGTIVVTVAGHSHRLVPGGIVHIPARVPHTVHAHEPSVVALTLLGRPVRAPER